MFPLSGPLAGDNDNTLWIVLIAVAVLMLLAVVFLGKKK